MKPDAGLLPSCVFAFILFTSLICAAGLCFFGWTHIYGDSMPDIGGAFIVAAVFIIATVLVGSLAIK